MLKESEESESSTQAATSNTNNNTLTKTTAADLSSSQSILSDGSQESSRKLDIDDRTLVLSDEEKIMLNKRSLWVSYYYFICV